MQTKTQARAAALAAGNSKRISKQIAAEVETDYQDDLALRSEPDLMDRLSKPLKCQRIETWEAFALAPVQESLNHWRAITDVEAWTELVQGVEDGDIGVWAVGHSNRILGLLIIHLPFNSLWPWPYVDHLRVEPDAPPAAKRMLMEAGVAFMKEAGYDRFWTMNVSGIDDEVWERVFRGAGEPIRRGSVYEVAI